jgi:hypothetical protein
MPMSNRPSKSGVYQILVNRFYKLKHLREVILITSSYVIILIDRLCFYEIKIQLFCNCFQYLISLQHHIHLPLGVSRLLSWRLSGALN